MAPQSENLADEIDLEYITWSLPLDSDGKGRSTRVKILPAELFNPGAYIARPVRGSEGAWLKKRCAAFQSTVSTRCVRDIKRQFSWKIYNVCYNAHVGANAHYVRIQFPDREKDDLFVVYATALNSVAARRFMQYPNARPFGVGFDVGTPTKDRLYLISNCAKQTPHLRRVTVMLEVLIAGTWQRVDEPIDRIGFATYKSVKKSDIAAAATPETVHFKDDAYLRFARVTLRFGKRKERTVLDVGKSFSPAFLPSKQSAIVSLSNVRVRTCDGKCATRPITTTVRLVFTNRDRRSGSSLLLPNSKSPAVAEAGKVLALMKRAVHLAAQNTLDFDDALDDDAMFEITLRDVRAPVIRCFAGATAFLVPCYATNGLYIVTQTYDGEQALRQYIPSPITFISTITATSFSGPKTSTLTTARSTREVTGNVSYLLANGESDAAKVVEIVVAIMQKLHSFQTRPKGRGYGVARVYPRVGVGRG